MQNAWGEEKCDGILIGMPEGRKSLGTSMRICEDNIKMDVRDTAGVDWIYMALDKDR
jgi:hypothetical protein